MTDTLRQLAHPVANSEFRRTLRMTIAKRMTAKAWVKWCNQKSNYRYGR